MRISNVRPVVRGTIACALAGMGVVHFTPSGVRTMRAMLPPVMRHGRIPPEALVRFTGLCELAGAVGLLVPALRRPAGAALVVFLAAVFPANAEAARRPERFGALAVPFLPRLAAQCALGALVAWVATD